MIGLGKASAIKDFLADKGVSAQSCYAFGDDVSDLPMLEIVGKPVIIEGDSELVSIAEDRKWRIVRINNGLLTLN